MRLKRFLIHILKQYKIKLIMFFSLLCYTTLCMGITCTVNATSLAFGNINRSSDTTSNGTVTLSCQSVSTLTTVSILLSQGSSGNYTQRFLRSANNTLIYNIYVDPTRRNIWGDNSSGTFINTAQCQAGTTCNQPFTAYGLIKAQPAAIPGTYSDSIVVTASF